MKKEKMINMKTKAAKLFMNHKVKGMTKVQAAREAGIKDIRNVTNMERTQTYQALEQKYAGKLQKIIELDEVAQEHVKLIRQDQDKGAKLNAIKYYKDQVEPDERASDDDDKMIIVFR